jgi:hypothetical protein
MRANCRVTALTLAFCLICALACAENTSKPAAAVKAQPFHLIADYLPAAIYEDDAFSASFRIENTTSRLAELDSSLSIRDKTGKELSRENGKLSVPANGFASWRPNCVPGAGQMLIFELRDGENAVGSLRARLVRENDPLPPTRILDGRLALDMPAGDLIIFLAPKRLPAAKHAYGALQWLLGGEGARMESGKEKVLLCLPSGWQPAGEGLAVAMLALGPYEADLSPPLLRALVQLCALKAVPERVIILLPPEDLRLATAPSVYRLVLETLLARLTRGGTKQITLIPPLCFGTPAGERKALWQAVFDAAASYELRAVDFSACLQENFWRVDPAEEGAYGLRPNAEGLKKIGQELAKLLE